MPPTKVLVVDDNELYRKAFARNLLLRDYDVAEAENADEALAKLEQDRPDLVVTDLSMRTPTEGLDLIRSLKQRDPLQPVVLISAVGTFVEGSAAKELGADRVLMKQRIDDHIDELYKAIDEARATGERQRALRAEVERLSADPDAISPQAMARLREIAAIPRLHPSVLAETYDAILAAQGVEIRAQLDKEFEKAPQLRMAEVDKDLKAQFPEFDRFAPETQKEIRTAEYFYRQQGGDTPDRRVDFSRNIGFSFCFAVENEAKNRLRKKLHKFLSDNANIKLIRSLVDQRTGQLDIFYHQQLLRVQQVIHFDFTVDNVRQVFQRILEHESRYKPDGLKALGIAIACFGRDYTVKGIKGQVRINNPLALRGFNSDDEVLHFARLLVSLQHYRNPYIHPEISEMEKVSKIREATFECLREISRLA